MDNFFMTRHISNYPLLTFKQIIGLFCGRKADNNHSANIKLISNTRSAVKIWIQENLNKQDQIYIPSYICSDVTIPLTEMGQLITYYPCKDNLEPDWEWLENNITNDCKALLLVHYFGFPNDIDYALTFANQHNIILLEDCAHSFLTRIHGKIIGTFGEAGFYSYHKTLPIPDGAGIYDQRTSDANLQKYIDQTNQIISLEWTKRLVIALLHNLYMTSFIWNILSHSYNQLKSPPASKPASRMSALSEKILHSYESDFDNLIKSRRNNYELLANELNYLETCTLLFPDLDEGICPYALPITVEDPAQYISYLNRQGVPAQRWPDLPKEVLNDPIFSVSTKYASQVILLPIHQSLNEKSIHKIALIFKSASLFISGLQI